MPNTPATMVARGTIYPSRFVIVDTASNCGVTQATANAKCFAVSQQGTNYAPLSDILTTAQPAATNGQELRLYGDGDVCAVEAGGSITAGDYVKSDANGKAVSSATSGTTVQFIGGQALEAATASGQLILIQVKTFPYLPAVA